MSTLLSSPLDQVLNVSESAADISDVVAAFVVRVAAVALAAARVSPPAEVARAISSGSSAGLVSALAELMAFEAPAEDVLTRPLLRGRLALATLLESSGGVWSSEQALAHLQVSRTTLQNWRDQNRILALQRSAGSFVYPVAQFATPDTDIAAPRPYSALAEVLTAARGTLTPEELFAILAAPQEILAAADGDNRTAFEALAAGDGAAVVALIEHLVAPADAGAPAMSATTLG